MQRQEHGLPAEEIDDFDDTKMMLANRFVFAALFDVLLLPSAFAPLCAVVFFCSFVLSFPNPFLLVDCCCVVIWPRINSYHNLCYRWNQMSNSERLVRNFTWVNKLKGRIALHISPSGKVQDVALAQACVDLLKGELLLSLSLFLCMVSLSVCFDLFVLGCGRVRV